jgi:exodeoxyribonuclease-3
MRVVSWNVNGIRAVEKRGFIDWLAKENPDILCLNETKAEPGQLSPKLVNPPVQGAPYSSFWANAVKKGYSGVAVYTKEKPDDVHFLGIEEFDDEGRVLIAEY